MRAAIIIYPGVEELDAIGPFEVFGLLAEKHDITCSLVGPKPQSRCAHGLEITGIAPLGGKRFDLIIVPGGSWIDKRDTGVRAEIAAGEIPSWLAAQASAGATIAAVCTGTFLVHAAGLLAGRRATTHHLALADLQALGVEISTERIVDEGSLLTCGGITSGIDLALYLAERFFGVEAAAHCRKVLEYP